MLKPFTNYLATHRTTIEAKLDSLPPESPELLHMLETYERLQSVAIVEHLEEDLTTATPERRPRLYQQFIKISSLRERVAARQSREKLQRQRAQERTDRDQRRQSLLAAKQRLREEKDTHRRSRPGSGVPPHSVWGSESPDPNNPTRTVELLQRTVS